MACVRLRGSEAQCRTPVSTVQCSKTDREARELKGKAGWLHSVCTLHSGDGTTDGRTLVVFWLAGGAVQNSAGSGIIDLDQQQARALFVWCSAA